MTTTKERYAGLTAVSGAGRDVLIYGEFAGAAAGHVGAECGCAAVGGAGNAGGAVVSYRCVGGFPEHMHCVWTLPPGDDD